MLLRAYALPKIRSPLEGEAVECANLVQVTASPLRDFTLSLERK